MVEILVASCILAIVAASVSGVLFSGLKLWGYISSSYNREPEIILGLEGISRNLRHSFSGALGNFSGGKTSLEFFSVLNNDPVAIKYAYNFTANAVVESKNIPEGGLYGSGQEKSRNIFRADGWELAYLVRAGADKNLIWSDSAAVLPWAVKIKVKAGDCELERVIAVPVARK